MSTMRQCESIDFENGFSALVVAAKELNLEFSDNNYQEVKKYIMEKLVFSMKRHGYATVGRSQCGQWERRTNGQDPIWKTYQGSVCFLGTKHEAMEFLSQLPLSQQKNALVSASTLARAGGDEAVGLITESIVTCLFG